MSEFADTAEWDAWIRERDAQIRGRIDHGIDDSISELILFGTSFPAPPKLSSAAQAVTPAGNLTTNARARVKAFMDAIDQIDNERFRMVLDYLRRRRVSEEELDAFLAGNLRRFALEEAPLKLNQTRADVGVSPETSLLINFAIDDTLRALKSRGVLPKQIHRIAVIGPGLDLAGDPEVYDFCPIQSVQPFAVLETALRLGAAQPADVQVTALDMNPFVLSHLRIILGKARTGQNYVVQLPRATAAGWNSAAIAYWQRFGETIGTAATAAQMPPPGVEVRAIAVKAQIAARVTVEDANIVAQTMDTAPGPAFDLVVATNLFGYYTRVEQSLALTGIARMMSSGGILVLNGMSATSRIPEFEDLGSRRVVYTDGGIGDDLLTLRRR